MKERIYQNPEFENKKDLVNYLVENNIVNKHFERLPVPNTTDYLETLAIFSGERTDSAYYNKSVAGLHLSCKSSPLVTRININDFKQSNVGGMAMSILEGKFFKDEYYSEFKEFGINRMKKLWPSTVKYVEDPILPRESFDLIYGDPDRFFARNPDDLNIPKAILEEIPYRKEYFRKERQIALCPIMPNSNGNYATFEFREPTIMGDLYYSAKPIPPELLNNSLMREAIKRSAIMYSFAGNLDTLHSNWRKYAALNKDLLTPETLTAIDILHPIK